jgi:hypothetical protein
MIRDFAKPFWCLMLNNFYLLFIELQLFVNGLLCDEGI